MIDVFQAMQARNLVPDHASRNAVLAACERLGQGMRAYFILTGMLTTSVQPDTAQLSTVVQALWQGGTVAMQVNKAAARHAAGRHMLQHGKGVLQSVIQ